MPAQPAVMPAAMTPRPLLRIEDLSVRFGGTVALDGVSVDVEHGEILGIIGPNGAGKTTLLNCVSGVYSYQQGQISLAGRSLARCRPHEIAALGIARAFQHPALLPDLTVLENLLLGRHLKVRFGPAGWLGLGGRVRTLEEPHRAVAQEVLDLLGLPHLARRTAGDLPYGLQKLVELGRAVAAEPRVLLLDEPSSGLHHLEREQLRQHLRALHRQKDLTVVLIEHNLQLVADLCDRIVVLDFGKRIAYGTPAEIFADEGVIAAYLGTAD